MRKPPGLVIIVDPSKEHLAVSEARKLGIPIMALVDTNCDPDPINHVIACNDDALKSIKIILQCLSNAIIDKKNELKVLAIKDDRESDEEEVLPKKKHGSSIKED
jgi:small subunit ribosomal protein S2